MVLDRRNEGQPILRSYYQISLVKPNEKGDCLLEGVLHPGTCVADWTTCATLSASRLPRKQNRHDDRGKKSNG